MMRESSLASAGDAPRLLTLLPVVALSLLYLSSRLHSLLALPPFIDESDNIFWAQGVWHLQPLAAAGVGHLLNKWWLSAFWPFNEPFWVSRAATVLLGTIGVCAVYATARRLFSHGAGVISSALYALSPLSFFFDRLAIAEPAAAASGALVVCTSVWFVRSGRRWHAVACGVALATALIAKASMAIFFTGPFLAGVSLSTKGSRKRAMRLAAWAYVSAALMWVPFWLLLTAKGYNYFHFAETQIGVPSLNAGGTYVANMRFIIEQLVAYFSLPVITLFGLSAVYLVAVRARGAVYLLTVMAWTAFSLAVVARTWFAGRYVLSLSPLLVIVLGAGLAVASEAMAHRVGAFRSFVRIGLPSVAVGIWALMLALPFFTTAYTQPEGLSLSSGDRQEYVESQSAGYGRREAIAYLVEMATQRGTPVYAVGLVADCRGMGLMLPPESGVVLNCPTIAWDGSRQSEIEDRVQKLVAEHDVYILEEGLPYVDVTISGVHLIQVETFPRPGDGEAVRILHASQQ